MKLGCIGDDFTGSSDLALMLRDQGMATVQYVGTPQCDASQNVEAGVVALKTRSVDVADAVRLTLEAYHWLKSQGCSQIFFKYCSTFDSTPQGNIGPVLEALFMEITPDHPVLVCPAFPATGRTIYQGHLFVGGRLLSECGMENHPITPMTDPDIRRWLDLQTTLEVGHLPYEDLQGKNAQNKLQSEYAAGHKLIVCDAVLDDDLLRLGALAKEHLLVSGGSGLAMGLPENHGCKRRSKPDWQGGTGAALVLSGSCSTTTLAQIDHHIKQGNPTFRITPADLLSEGISADTVLDWVDAQQGLPLIYSSGSTDDIAQNKQTFGEAQSAQVIETFFAALAKAAVARGYTRLIIAGGETSGAVVETLDVAALIIGPSIDPGVPALKVEGAQVFLALKSGNFGAQDFFDKAAKILGDT